MQELYGSAQQEVYGNVRSAHQWVNMTDVTVQINSTHTVRNQIYLDSFKILLNRVKWNIKLKLIDVYHHQVKTCKPALGHSFAAGTIDGGGDLNFTQGTSISILWASSCMGCI